MNLRLSLVHGWAGSSVMTGFMDAQMRNSFRIKNSCDTVPVLYVIPGTDTASSQVPVTHPRFLPPKEISFSKQKGAHLRDASPQ